eukprot:TRINITY_DN12510_c3_g1_i13.p4 TRINITY_DN12510_c3_g1~~TRINITY_DN12510_c3_g1_i13.p4  ORF type:complete len:102 (+),score=1.12 TRINITY_DN12510_c3_g1_i13:3232-3537(+)
MKLHKFDALIEIAPCDHADKSVCQQVGSRCMHASSIRCRPAQRSRPNVHRNELDSTCCDKLYLSSASQLNSNPSSARNLTTEALPLPRRAYNNIVSFCPAS